MGPIESAADYMATTILASREIHGAESTETLKRYGLAAADAFATSWQLAAERKMTMPYWDQHSLGIQRYYSIVCLIYGSDTESEHYAHRVRELPAARASGCDAEFAQASAALKWMLRNYEPAKDQVNFAQLTFQYEKTKTMQQQWAVDEIRRLNLLEQTVNTMARDFSLEKDFKVSMRSCGMPEASWNPQNRELTICYELFDAYHYIFRHNAAKNG